MKLFSSFLAGIIISRNIKDGDFHEACGDKMDLFASAASFSGLDGKFFCWWVFLSSWRRNRDWRPGCGSGGIQRYNQRNLGKRRTSGIQRRSKWLTSLLKTWPRVVPD